MDIRNRKELTSFAAQRLENAPQHKKIALIYASVIVGLSLVSGVLSYVLGLQIDQSGGLSNLGTRSILSALQTMLPLVTSVISICVELGFGAVMLRIARGQYTSPNTLRLGFDRFWVLLRYTILESLLYIGLVISSAYMGVMLFMMTPMSRKAMELLVPVVSGATVLDPAATIPAAIYDAVVEAMIPAFILCGIFYCVAAVPFMYRLRMSRYVIIDKPALGALAAMRESRKMTRKNCMKLFRLDLHLWWFYAASFLASVVCYGDQLLPMLGVELPFSADVSFFLFYALYWVLEYLIIYFLQTRVRVVYGLAYDAIRPQEQPTDGVVLGNIFQM